MDKVAVLIPCYNESKTVKKVVEDFRKAYLADAIRPEEYEDYGPVVLFRSSFEAAWKNALAEVARRRTQLK